MELKTIIYDYFDYREYLNDIFNHYKKVDPTFSHRKFLSDAAIPGSTYLLRVLRGERKLSTKYVANFSDAIRHSEAEANYFALLVHFVNEKNVDTRDQLLKKLIKIRRYCN